MVVSPMDDASDQGAIMASLDPTVNDSPPDVVSTPTLPEILSTELRSLNLHADEDLGRLSFLLLDGNDRLRSDSEQHFVARLGCDRDEGSSIKAKVVSIVGNTGEGKSYALNRSLFSNYGGGGGDDSSGSEAEVFCTSPSAENSCTRGVWAAYEPRYQLVVLDTEGMLGNGGSGSLSCEDEPNENLRTRQLLKVLAVSDIVIYKTRAERLHSDLFYFLGDASKAYNEHFSTELQKVFGKERCCSMMGPTVVVFHETQFTDVLGKPDESSKSPDMIIRDRLAALNQDASAFSKIAYYGVKRSQKGDAAGEAEVFSQLRRIVVAEAKNTSVRSPRSLSLIYRTLQSLNAKFSAAISPVSHRSFPDEYFTCQARCGACIGRCWKAMNHEEEHQSRTVCIYQKSLDNKRYFCLRCYQNGRRVVVVPKASSSDDGGWLGLATYAWSGHVLECKICGVIFRSRKHWYGNESPETQQVVQTEVSHIWPGVRTLQGTHNAARRLLDGVQALSTTVSSLSSAIGPTRSVTDWVADKIAPDYWRPNSEITHCHSCGVKFVDVVNADAAAAEGSALSSIHHCRSCGEGFCDECSSYRRPVPERGWDPSESVRVCRRCFKPSQRNNNNNGRIAAQDTTVQARKYGERVVGTLNSLASAVLEYPISALKDSARPSYWVPDDEIDNCHVCDIAFEKGGGGGSMSSSATELSPPPPPKSKSSSPSPRLHHCRQCGQGVCDDCSRARTPVPTMGWDHPVRVCDKCKASNKA